MTRQNRGTISVWMDEAPPQELDPLRESTSADVCIVGGGIAGLSIAYELAAKGASVVVLDDGPIGGGETSRTTAHLVTALDERYFELERVHGADGAAIAARSHATAIDRIEAIIAAEEIKCDFERLDGLLFVPAERGEEADELIRREHAAAARAGIGVEILPDTPMLNVPTGPCLRFPDQAQFHPLRYLTGLARAINARGGRIFTGSHVETIGGGAAAYAETTEGFTVHSRAMVVATNTPVNDIVTMHTKQVAYRSYVLAMTLKDRDLRPALLWDGYWDRDTPYHYVRLAASRPGGPADLLIVGGEDHKTGHEQDPQPRFRRLEEWARARFHGAGEVVRHWSGQIMEPHDELAFIGRNPGDRENVFIVTGDSGNGMTHAVIAGLMLPDLIAGREHAWTRLYSPSRFSVKATPTALAEAVDMVAQYRDWVTPHGDAEQVQLAPGTGAVLRVNGVLAAVYRDWNGQVSARSAVCPHLKGVVRWNPVERSWDCPCHGSRFDCDGRVINGPANRDLDGIPPATAPQQASPRSVIPDPSM